MLPDCQGGVGLRVYRAADANGPYACVTPEPLACAELGSFVDETVWASETFWYELRAVLASGQEVPAIDTRASVTVPGKRAFEIQFVRPNPAA